MSWPSSSVEPELRRATIAFVDILGFSALSEQAGPEVAYRVVSGLLKLLDEIARRHGGAVDKYLGDAMMIVFGVPFAVSRPEVAAVAAAAEMLEATAGYSRQVASPLPLELHVGINTGDVLASDVHGPIAREFAVMGDAVNIAARLKERAPAGAVYVGHDTWLEARSSFAFSALEPLKLKGKEKSVETFALERSSAREEELGDAVDAFAGVPLVGREAELARLRGALEELRSGRGGIVVLSGPAGSGKSRLLRELRATAGAPEVRWHVLRCGRGATQAELDAIDDLLTLSPPAPRVFVVEDLQDADEAAIRLLDSLLPGAADIPALCLLAERRTPGETRSVAHACIGPLRPTIEIALGALDEAEARSLVDRLCADRDVPEPTRDLVRARAAGNPLRLITGAWLATALETQAELEQHEPERSAEAERRRATVLFADITGFTRMSEQMEPRAARSIVSGCLRVLHEVAAKHGGFVEKYLGDCVLALFGVPVALEDAPRAAVNASIEMLRRVREYSLEKSLDPPLGVHIGIDTGLGIAADVSGPVLREFALMGDTVNVASLLKDVAPPGRVWVGAETHRATRRSFEYRPVPPVSKGGRGGSIAAFELASDREQIYRSKVGTGETLFASLIGREAEVAALRAELARLASGEGGIVAVVGEPGLGKSRLLSELAQTPEARAIDWLEGRSVAVGQGLRYHPLVDLLRHFAGVEEKDDDGQAAAKLERRVADAVGAEAAEVFPFLATPMGLPLAETHRERVASVKAEALDRLILKSLKETLSAAARARPLALVFEDLHWADRSSIELLIDLLRIANEAPVLFLFVTRPGFKDTGEWIVEAGRATLGERMREIELAPLDAEGTRRLLTDLFPPGDLPRQVRDRIEGQAAGNPLYVEEVLRSLIDQGIVDVTPEGLRATAATADAAIPATVQEVILSRIDWLPPRRKLVAQISSVLSRSFPLSLIARVVDERDEPAELEHELEELVAAQLLRRQTQQGTVEYAFKHRMIQQVAYESMLETKRIELHRRVAEAVLAELPETSPGYHGMLAYHFSMSRDLERAEEFLFRAGDEAARVAAAAEALSFFEEASRLYLLQHGEKADPAKLAELEKRLAGAFLHRGHMVDANRHYNRAIELRGKRVPKRRGEMMARAAATLLSEAAEAWLSLRSRRRPPASDGDRDLIELMFNRARAQTTADPTRFVFDSTELLRTLRSVDPGTVPNAGGMYAAAIGLFSFGGVSFTMSERFLELAQQYVHSGDVAEVFLVRMMTFFHHFLAGDWDARHEIDFGLVDAAVGVGQLWDAASHLGLEAAKKVAQGQFAEAEIREERIRQIEEAYSYDLARSNRHSTLAFLHTERRDLDRALAAAHVYATEHEDPNINVVALSVKAKVQVLRGEIDGACATLDTLERLRARMGRLPPFYTSQMQRSRLLLALREIEAARARGDEATARTLLREARATARHAAAAAAKVAWLRPEVYRLVALVQWHADRPRRAFRWWERAFREGDRLGARPELGRMHLDVGRTLAGRDFASVRIAGRSAREHLEAARELFVALDLVSDLAESEEAARRPRRAA